MLEFIFTTCTENVIFRKEISLEKSVSEILMPIEDPMNSREHFMVTIKRIFKLRYTDSIYFKFICKFCWLIGMECPLLIPFDIVAKLANAKDNITRENEQQLLHMTLANLYGYHPDKNNTIRIGVSTGNNEKSSLIPRSIVTPLDKTIGDLQKEIFRIQGHSGYTPNVL